MTQKPSPERLRKRLDQLPDPILSSKRFLLWKYVPVPGKKPRKVPFYANGRARQGEVDTPEDLKQLTTLDKALSAMARLEMDGIGLALVGEGVGAFDLDDCLTPDGDLRQDHPGAPIVAAAEARGAYIEVSPSGKGLRIIGTSDIPEAYSKDGLEYWGAGRYVTVTGSVWSGSKGWATLTDLREPLRSRRDDPIEETEVLATPRVINELRSALASMESDERDLWIRMGHALKGIGNKGLDLWLEWSAKSDKFDEADARAKWETFRPQHTNFKAVFAEASRWGWENPRKRENRQNPKDGDEEEVTSILDNQIDLGDLKLYPTEFVLDGFLPVGVSIIAGAWGAGKSTNLIPLFTAVAHLAPEEWGFHPSLRRHVIWITEAPDQARDTLYSLAQTQETKSWPEFKEWFHLLPARRKAPEVLAKMIEKALPLLTYETEKGFKVQPVVVLDTTSANLDLENESDNSEVGAAMAAIKERLAGVPVVLVGHTPKALARADIDDMTFRGAGAWEGDAVATYYLVYDPETDFRFMALRKVRFTPDYKEISFGQEGGRELVATPWGDPQSKSYLHGVPQKSNGDERKAAQRIAREERREAERERGLTQRQSRIMEAVTLAADNLQAFTKASAREIVGGKAELVPEAINRLIEGGLVISLQPPRDLWEIWGFSGRVPDILLPADLDLGLYWDRVKGSGRGE